MEDDAVGSVSSLWRSLVLFFFDVKFQVVSGKGDEGLMHFCGCNIETPSLIRHEVNKLVN